MQSAFRKSAWAGAGSKPPYEPYYEGDLAWRYAPTCGMKGRVSDKNGTPLLRDLTAKRGLCSANKLQN